MVSQQNVCISLKRFNFFLFFMYDLFLAFMKRMSPFDTNATKEDSINVAVSEMKLQAERGKQ